VPIASLREGDLVLSVHRGRVATVPILRTNKNQVGADHVMMRLTLASGRAVTMSPRHPAADGRPFEALAPGDRLGDSIIVALDRVPYDEPYTYDILPASDTGSYFAAGALVGSTLAPGFARTCP
jgi:hypothetical protein